VLKYALFFALAALVIGLCAPMLFPDGANFFSLGATPPSIVSAPTAPAPSPQLQADSVDSGFREASIAADAGGQFHASVLIEGQAVEMMVDTGATVVAISAATAGRLGVFPDLGAAKWRMSTANGVSFASPVVLRRVSVGSIEMTDVQAVVMPREAGMIDLLGASFLKRLASVEQRDGVLLLKQ
jgi:aspartyl protease family protein